jgi:tRNA(Arg) A34 adenosine deaminase TadA
VPGPDFAAARASLDAAAWRALEQAYEALTAGGLPCGAALADAAGAIVACGRNHAFDPLSGDDPLQGTPLAHAELNVLARVRTDRDLSADTLWSTQQPCAMCTAAIGFCGVGRTRYLAADPAFLGTSDPRAGVVVDPTRADPALAPWAALANAMFLWPTISRTGPGGDHIRRNHQADPGRAG